MILVDVLLFRKKKNYFYFQTYQKGNFGLYKFFLKFFERYIRPQIIMNNFFKSKV